MKRTLLYTSIAVLSLAFASSGSALAVEQTASPASQATSSTAAPMTAKQASTGHDQNLDSVTTASAGGGSTIGDSTFYQKALSGGEKEIELSKAAQQQSQSTDVLNIASMMIKDHTALGNTVKEAAPGPTPTAADPDKIASIKALKGAYFNAAFLSEMKTDHEKTIALFEKEAMSGVSAEARKIALDALPILRQHLQAITAAQAKM